MYSRRANKNRRFHKKNEKFFVKNRFFVLAQLRKIKIIPKQYRLQEL
jgi:hypothetical protein